MKFRVAQEVFDQFPEYIVPVIVATIDQSAYQQTQLESVAPVTHQNFVAWQEAFAAARIQEDHKPSHVALMERWQKTGELPSIFPIVDFLNQISLRFAVPIGAHDLDKLESDIVVRRTTSHDWFIPRGTQEKQGVAPGIFAYTSDDKVLTKDWIWRQGETSAVSAQTQRVFIPIDQLSTESDEHVTHTTQEIARMLEEQFGATTEIFFVSRANPECEWDVSAFYSEAEAMANELLTRAVAQILPAKNSLQQLMRQKKIRLYLGIDPTGSLLHLGHAVVLRKLNQFAQAGHEVILLIGNGTVRIGDPTGRDTTRPVLTDEVIEENFKSWKEQASRILDFSKIRIMRNGDWLDELTYADMVRLMAQTTVQQLIERDMFQKRLKDGLPIFGHEIMYPLLQGYDSVAMNVDLEIGGTDQTFNMMMGRHLQKVYNNHEKWVLTTPIINGTDGRKMGKSYGNYVALTENPIDMFGKLMSVGDELILEYFTLLTDVPSSELQAMKQAIAAGENPMVYKKKLAFTITADLHNEEQARQAQQHFENTVQNKQIPENIPVIHATDGTVLELLQNAYPGKSNGELRRLIQQGAVKIDGEKKQEAGEQIIVSNGMIVKVGKLDYFQLMRTNV